MEACCNIILFGAVGYGIWMLYLAYQEAQAKKRKRINDSLAAFNGAQSSFSSRENQIRSLITQFFASTAVTARYENTYAELAQTIAWFDSDIDKMAAANNKLIQDAREQDQSSKIAALKNRSIPQAKSIAEGFLAFGKKIESFPANVMMEDSYGKVNKAYWDEINSMSRADAMDYINRCEYLLGNTDFSNLYAIDLNKVLKCIWFFATEKTFSASDFQKAQNVFSRIYKRTHSDVIIADLYAKKKMGGEDVLRDTIRGLLKVEQDSQKLTQIASALMWMNAYQSENTVLQHMLTSGKEMTAKTQERLHSLTNGGGKAPSGFEVKSGINELYFDVSALAWKDDEYVGLFENLAFQDKILTYSLALREENKDLFIPQGIQVPSAEEVLNKLNAVFSEEYGSGVTARIVNCIALSGSGEEKMDGIVASSRECRQMGILIHIARIGKKLIIKFYTLFTPADSDLAAQKQQALSMFKKLSPTVTMWEGSLKDTMLMAVEQLLNTSAQSAPSSSSAASPDETVF